MNYIPLEPTKKSQVNERPVKQPKKDQLAKQQNENKVPSTPYTSKVDNQLPVNVNDIYWSTTIGTYMMQLCSSIYTID